MSLNTDDIPGSKPKSFRQVRRSYSSLGNDDIVGSKPNYAKKFDKKPQVIQGYEPEAIDNGFSMAFFGPKLPEKKFLKDPLNRDDIDGARARAKNHSKTRSVMRIDDIEGARPSQLIVPDEKKNRNHNCLDYRDVNSKKKLMRRFSTNPLNPDYAQGAGVSDLSKSQMLPSGALKEALEGAAPPNLADKLLSKAHEEQRKKCFEPSAEKDQPMRLQGKKRFENVNKNASSSSTKAYTYGKPPTYKQTFKRWNY